MSGKLGLNRAYNRPPLPSISTDIENKSASYAKLEREINQLRAKNAKQKIELDDVRCALKQVMSENSHEKFDERRINLIKLQVIQLERQIAILGEALGSRQEAIMEVENVMAWLSDRLRSYIATEVKGPVVPIARTDLISMVESSESARIKLFKAMENSGKDKVGKDLLFLNPFLCGKHKQEDPLSLLDISLNRMDFVNLRHVAQLESKLSLLYKELIRVEDQIQNVTKERVDVGLVSSVEKDRLETVLLKTCVMIRDVTDDLLALSFLCPSAPWPALTRPVSKLVPIERVIAALPTLPYKKQEEVSHVIESTVRTCNHRQYLLDKEKEVLKEELTFHRSVYHLQMQYAKDLFKAVGKGYEQFEDSARSVIAQPIKNMLDAYSKLKSSASEEALKDFLIIIKENEEQLKSIVENLQQLNFSADESGAVIFSKFHEEFSTRIQVLAQECQKKRDMALEKKREVKEEQMQIDSELQHLIEKLEAKHETQWTPKTISLLSAPEQMLDSKTDHHARWSNDFSNQNSLSEQHQSVEIYESEMKDMSTNTQQTTDHIGLRPFLNGDNTNWVDIHTEQVNDLAASEKSNCKKEWVHDFVIANETIESGMIKHEQDFSATVKKDKEKKTPNRWKPKVEWVCDFSNTPDDSDNHLYLDSFRGSCSRANDFQNSGHIGDEIMIKDSARMKNESKAKTLSYEPNLQVANRTLKLRRAGSMSSVNTASSHDKSLNSGGPEFYMDRQNSHQQTSDRQQLRSGRVARDKSANRQKRSSWR